MQWHLKVSENLLLLRKYDLKHDHIVDKEKSFICVVAKVQDPV